MPCPQYLLFSLLSCSVYVKVQCVMVGVQWSTLCSQALKYAEAFPED